MLTVIWGGPLLRILRHFKIGKLIRVEGPDQPHDQDGHPHHGRRHDHPAGAAADRPAERRLPDRSRTCSGRSVLVPLLVMLAFGLLGAVDDWEGIRGPRRGLGMRARTKFLFQVILALGIAFALQLHAGCAAAVLARLRRAHRPRLAGTSRSPSFIIVGMSNAVNFTDGLDGLAGLICRHRFRRLRRYRPAAGADLPGALLLHPGRRALRLSVVQRPPGPVVHGRYRLAVAGRHPGRGRPDDRPVAAPAADRHHPGQRSAVSVILQIGYFKLTKGKRFFKMAPLHHHFELLGWSETQVVQRFWLISLLAAMLGMALALV